MTESFPAAPIEDDVQRQAADIARGVVDGIGENTSAQTTGKTAEALAPVREALAEANVPIDSKRQIGFKYGTRVNYVGVVPNMDKVDVNDVQHSGTTVTLKGQTSKSNVQYVASEGSDEVSVVREHKTETTQPENGRDYSEPVQGAVTKLTGSRAERAALLLGKEGAQTIRDVKTSNDIIDRRRS